MDERKGGGFIPTRLIVGLVIIGIGGLLALDNLGYLSFHIHWHEYWPVILIVLGLNRIFGGRRHVTGGFVLLFIGGWFLAHNLYEFDLDSRLFFPFLLVLVGILMVVGSVYRGLGRRDWHLGADSRIDLHPLAILGGARTGSTSQEFRGGTATAILGSCTLDLRDAAIAPGQEAVIDALAFWGGVLILVPDTWEVVLRGVPVLGSFQDLTQRPAGSSSQRLVLRGVALMGGVEVRNRREDRL